MRSNKGKFFAVVLMIALVVSVNCVADEIRCRGIPWGSNVPEVLGYLATDFGKPRAHNKLTSDSIGDKATGLEFVVDPRETMTVGGYDLSYLRLSFRYKVEDGHLLTDHEDLRLFSAVYYLTPVDKDFAYGDLKDKLTKLYGEGREESIIFDGIQCIWTGDNGSQVTLENGFVFLKVCYEIDDSTWMSELEDVFLAEEKAAAEENYSGL